MKKEVKEFVKENKAVVLVSGLAIGGLIVTHLMDVKVKRDLLKWSHDFGTMIGRVIENTQPVATGMIESITENSDLGGVRIIGYGYDTSEFGEFGKVLATAFPHLDDRTKIDIMLDAVQVRS